MNTPEKIISQINQNGEIPKHRTDLGRCWAWTGGTQSDGYGVVSIHSKVVLVHRFIYELLVGKIKRGVQVLHHCDNVICCRPSHLFTGNASVNMQDMWNKNRHLRPIGRRNNHAKLKESQVLEIRARYALGGIKQADLAKEFGVSQANIGVIIRRETWFFI